MSKKLTLEKSLEKAEVAFEAAHDALRVAETEWLKGWDTPEESREEGLENFLGSNLASAIRGYNDALKALVDLDEQKDDMERKEAHGIQRQDSR
jgi:hypothetical protein